MPRDGRRGGGEVSARAALEGGSRRAPEGGSRPTPRARPRSWTRRPGERRSGLTTTAVGCRRSTSLWPWSWGRGRHARRSRHPRAGRLPPRQPPRCRVACPPVSPSRAPPTRPGASRARARRRCDRERARLRGGRAAARDRRGHDDPRRRLLDHGPGRKLPRGPRRPPSTASRRASPGSPGAAGPSRIAVADGHRCDLSSKSARSITLATADGTSGAAAASGRGGTVAVRISCRATARCRSRVRVCLDSSVKSVAPDAPHVRLTVDCVHVAVGLLGRHESGGAEQGARVRLGKPAQVRGEVPDPRDPEIEGPSASRRAWP